MVWFLGISRCIFLTRLDFCFGWGFLLAFLIKPCWRNRCLVCGAIMCHPLLCWILKVIFVHSFVNSYILNFPTSESTVTMSCLTTFSVNQGIRIHMEVGGMIFDGSQYHFQWYWVTRQDLRFVYLIASIYHGKRCMNYHKFLLCSVIEFGWLAALFFNWQCLKQ